MKHDLSSIDLDTATYVGIDTHRYTHTAVAANRFEEKFGTLTFENTKMGINQFLSWIDEVSPTTSNTLVGIEGTGGYGKILTKAVCQSFPVFEVNPILTKSRRRFNVGGEKTDEDDALLIVEILTRKLKRLPQVVHTPNPTIDHLAEMISHHDDLVRVTTMLKNQLHNLMANERPECKTTRAKAFSTKSINKWLRYTNYRSERRVRFPQSHVRCQIIASKLKQLKYLKNVIAKQDQELKYLLEETGSNLKTLPGVGAIVQAKILVAAKDIQRFNNLNAFVRYAGIAPVQRSSGKTKRFVQNKSGNRQLNTAIYTIALNQIRWNDKAKAYFDKKISEGKTKKHALRCLMKRIACIIYGMLRTNTPYQDR